MMLLNLVKRNSDRVSLRFHFRKTLTTAARMEGSLRKSKLQVNVDITSDVVCPW